MDLNSATLIKRGAATEKVEALARWRESALFGEREQAALEYAEATTYPEGGVDEKIFGRLKRRFDDDAIIMQLMTVVSPTLDALKKANFNGGVFPTR